LRPNEGEFSQQAIKRFREFSGQTVLLGIAQAKKVIPSSAGKPLATRTLGAYP
jgi:hypothetical protein